ncbi:MAG TPA: hypothetical protein G4N94_10495 [Caldilineae bacterium]|nr:hypothetical protein [Caldilineae bacterium]
MTEEPKRCIAITKAGNQCKNTARAGTDYCYVHRNYAATSDDETPAPDVVPVDRAELESLLAELNELTEELNRLVPDYSPPPYSPQGMLALLKGNLGRFTPEAVKDIQANLEGTTLDDFRDIETWKGMWFTLNYLVQLEASERTSGLTKRLSRLPGVGTISDLKEMLADTPPEEFLKVDTWKGIWFIANYEIRNQALSIKESLLGPSNEA